MPKPQAYYNEFDPFAAAWLRELIKAGIIAPGEVDERDIRDVVPNDLLGFTQCHFCAGIGVWSYSLRLAGWSDDRPVWTASFPCQPFSAAGAGKGVDDERHIWPHGFHLIAAAKQPDIPIIGEQVASKDGRAWFDLVQADMEMLDHATGAVDLCAAGFGAPHIRQRLYWVSARVGDTNCTRAKIGISEPEKWEEGVSEVYDHRSDRLFRSCEGRPTIGELANAKASRCNSGARLRDRGQTEQRREEPADDGGFGGIPNADGRQCERGTDGEGRQLDGQEAGREQSNGEPECRRSGEQLGNPTSRGSDSWEHGLQPQKRSVGRSSNQRPQSGFAGRLERPGPVNGFWGSSDWLRCRDDKWRPVEPGTFPLAHGAAARVGRLRGYGNAINAQQAQAFIEAVMEELA